jgi:predicted glycoside hydrolase/deacetylase ChbG (UPF0249 family)
MADSVRCLIVNGDDFGLSPGVNRGIMEAHRRGVLTSTSLMVLRPACDDAVDLTRRAPLLSVGLHLELGDLDRDPAAVVRDQFVRFERALGRPPTHVDGHRDLHLRAEWLPHVLIYAGRCGIPVRGRSSVVRLGRFYGQWGGKTHLEQTSVANLIEILRSGLSGAVTELVCHPGYVDPSLHSSYGREREAELETLCDARVREAIRALDVRLIGFRDLPGLVRPPSAAAGGAT